MYEKDILDYLSKPYSDDGAELDDWITFTRNVNKDILKG